jgi:hypothetical protein
LPQPRLRLESDRFDFGLRKHERRIEALVCLRFGVLRRSRNIEEALAIVDGHGYQPIAEDAKGVLCGLFLTLFRVGGCAETKSYELDHRTLAGSPTANQDVELTIRWLVVSIGQVGTKSSDPLLAFLESQNTVCWMLQWPSYAAWRVYRGVCWQARLYTRSRQETSNVDVAIRVHVGPHDCRTIAIRLSHD